MKERAGVCDAMKIVVAEEIGSNAVEKLRSLGDVVYEPSNLDAEIADADVLVVRALTKVDESLLDRSKNLKVVAMAGVGLDNIDVGLCKKKGIKVVNVLDASTKSVAELTIGLIILSLRKVLHAHHSVRSRKWKRNDLIGNEIDGKVIGIVGLGRIGSEVARMAGLFGANVIAYDPYVKVSEYAKLTSFDELLKSSDIISIHAMLTKETEGMINESAISNMKKGVCIVNMSRGALIDEDALYAALKSGKIGFAALDVFQKEPYDGKLLECENVIFTPHIGSNTFEAQGRIGEDLARQIREAMNR